MKSGKACIYLAVILLLALCISCTSREEKSEKAAPQKTQGALKPDSQKLLALLPEDNAVPGWVRGSEVRFFAPDDLFEYINGAAENYLIYGFEEVVTTEYKNSQKASEAVVEVYRMQDPRNAFGIYASELNPDSEFLQIGSEGYIGGTALHFWSGPYYSKITVFQESADLKQEMKLFAQRLSEKMGVSEATLPGIESLPAKDRIPHSVRYLPKDILGQTYLTQGFEARYRKGSSEFKLIVATPGDSEAAKEAIARYRQFTSSSGSVLRDLTSPADGGFLGKDSYYGNMAALRIGNRIVIALGGPSPEFALSQASASLK
ncbi:MAG: hypothetical protein JXA73_13785 [Acidobacteria bacterium]|nr:hypothetical protein [Acidobacteriota bacterium]